MKRRILFLEHSTDGTVGGSHLCLLEICRHLDSDRFQAVVCFFESNTLVDDFRAAGAEVHVLDMPGNWLPPRILPGIVARGIGFSVNLVRALFVRTALWMSLLRRLRIDIVHINNACGYDHDLMLAARLSRRPCLVHERGIQTQIGYRTRYFANRVNRILAISDAVADNLLNQGIRHERVVRIDDGIDASRFEQHESETVIRERYGIEAGVPVIGIVGNIKRWKGQHVVVDAVGILMREHPQLRCLFVGSIADAEYHQSLLSRARSAGIPEASLVFTGYVPHPADVMRIMDIVLHASVEPEPFGIVLLEAMGCGRPLIATNIGGPKEIVLHGETGYLVRPGDHEALASAIADLLGNPSAALRMGEKAQVRYRQRYTIQANVAAIEREYDAVLKRQGRIRISHTHQ